MMKTPFRGRRRINEITDQKKVSHQIVSTPFSCEEGGNV